MWPAGTRIHGRVVDHQNRPCPDAEVLLLGNEHIIVDADRRKWFVIERDRRGEALPSAKTDEQGDFTLSTGANSANRIAVISSELLLWVVSRKALTKPDDVLIQLPKPGRLVVHIDLPEKPRKLPVYIELRTFDDADWEPDRLRFHMSTFSVDNPGQRAFENLPPARYSVERANETPTGEHSILMTLCERKLVQVQSGKESDVRFEHEVGTMLSGTVKGLQDTKLRYATVTIDYWGPEEQPGRNGRRIRFGTHFDVIPVKADGHFLTDLMPPGTYDFVLFAVRDSTPEQSVQGSDFEGHTSITIPEHAKVDSVEIVATPRGVRQQKPRRRPVAAKSVK